MISQNEVGEAVESILNSETISVESEREHEPPRSSLINDVSEIRELINKSLNSTHPPNLTETGWQSRVNEYSEFLKTSVENISLISMGLENSVKRLSLELR